MSQCWYMMFAQRRGNVSCLQCDHKVGLRVNYTYLCGMNKIYSDGYNTNMKLFIKIIVIGLAYNIQIC